MSRLSEILERIRPAGAPGASAEGEGRREQDHFEHETAAIAAALAEFEAEASVLVEAARREASEILEDGERRARQIRARLPDRIAVAMTSVEDHGRAGAGDELDGVRDDSQSAVDRLGAQAADGIDEFVDVVVNSIWSILPTSPPEGERS